MKYIIKNCPCNVTTENMCDWENTNETYCDNCTDCLLKQIVKLCKKRINYCRSCYRPYMFTTCGDCPTNSNGLDKQILDLLEIEEIEE